MLSLVIFDCDGVLFDSWRANVAYYNAVMARLGLPALTPEWETRAHTLASVQLYHAMFGAESELAQAALRVGREVDYGPFYPLMLPAPGLDALLGELKRCYRLAMATNRGGTVRGVVAHFALDRFLDLAVGVHDVARPKPHPDMLEHCLAHFGVAPAAAVYVGDAATDRAAAAAAGMHFVAVGSDAGGAVRLDDLRELPACLDTLSATSRPPASD